MNLFELASCYSSLGFHRTGSSSQLKTEDWLLETLKEFTDEVEIFNYDYPHFEAATEVLLNGRLISSMALYYEAVGELQDCRNVDLVSVKIGEDEKGVFETIKEKKKHARQKKCDALVVATNCASDSLYAFNVNPLLNDSIPVVLIAGREYKNLSEQEIAERKNNVITNFESQVTTDIEVDVLRTFVDKYNLIRKIKIETVNDDIELF